ncbi:MAG: OB-fold domain-containing protein, partial [Syntrophales bacterium]|nr:OB-fold domain-containing protein [Syntrophales bacterium]
LVPLSDTGVITAFSVVNYPFIDPNTGAQRPIPYTYGYIRLDGADNIFSHIINEMDLNKIKVGMKVRAVFKEQAEMKGNIEDIRHFEIVG